MNNLLAIFAYVVLVVFLGILVWHVPRLDLFLIIAATLVLSGWDLLLGIRNSRR